MVWVHRKKVTFDIGLDKDTSPYGIPLSLPISHTFICAEIKQNILLCLDNFEEWLKSFHFLTLARHYALSIVRSKYFENFIIVCIILNALSMAVVDYSVANSNGDLIVQGSGRNEFADVADTVLSIIFEIECAIKIFALGFIARDGAYLNDQWHWIDFTVVITSIISQISNDGSLKALRTFRLLRPLKMLSYYPELQIIISSLLNAIPQLNDLFIVIAVVFFLFGVCGVQVFSGPQLHSRCRLTPYPVNNSWVQGLDPAPYKCLDAPLFNLQDEQPTWTRRKDSPWNIPQVLC